MHSRFLAPAACLAVAAALAASPVLSGGAAQARPADAAGRAAPTKAQIIEKMKAVNEYWIAHGPDQASNSWPNATFNVGNLAYVETTGVSNHYTLPWAKANKFELQSDPARPFFPDFEAAGEAYLELQKFHADAASLAPLRKRVKDEVASVKAGHLDYFSYVDALNMAMPSFVRLGVMDKKSADITTAQKLFVFAQTKIGGRGLYDPVAGLWWRDASAAGSHTYWSRGNGWAFAALAKVLQALPATDPSRAGYVTVFTRMAAALKAAQRTDGFWNVNLGDPTEFAGPETSGTALFTFGMAWGVNSGVLDSASYRPVAERAWQGLADTAVRADGLLGYVQGNATKPSDHQPVTATDTAAYGVGAFQLAGQQMAALES
jgi:unsaturated rhamnogalacturonyl hydrolase